MYAVILIVIVIAAVLMCGIVFVQESKGGGLASGFADSNSLLGVRKTTDFIEKATWGLAIVMVVCSIVCAHVAPKSTADESVIEKTAGDSNTNPNTLPNFGASQQQKQNAAQGAQQRAAQGAQGAQQSAAQGAKTAAPAAQGAQQPAAPAPAK